jgi:hypothetical protein
MGRIITENEGASFEIKALSLSIAKVIYDKLSKRMGFNEVAHNYSSMYEFLQQEGDHVKGCDALSSDFRINVLLEPYHLIESDDIIIIWDDVETIEMDTMPYGSFKNHLYDIWYPIAENIIFFNDKLEFVYLIRHDGVLFKMSLSK